MNESTQNFNLDTLFADHFKPHGIDQYSIDGVMNESEWANAPLRIAFLLKENYGYQDCEIFHTSDEAHGWVDAGIKTYLKLLTLSASILKGLELERALNECEIDEISKDRNLLHQTLNKIAVINIKKQSGKSSSKDAEIREHSTKNANLLQKQFQNIKPDLIITGSTVCWHSLSMDLKLFDEIPKCEKHTVTRVENQILCHTGHPGARFKQHFPIASLQKAIIEKLRSDTL